MGILKKFGVLAISVLMMLPLVGCKEAKDELQDSIISSINVSEEATKGYIWEATKDGKSINLVGTMHPAPKGINYFNETLNEVIENADILAVEVDITDKQVLNDFVRLQKENFFLKEGTLKGELSKEAFDKLDELLKKVGSSYSEVKNLNKEGLRQILSTLLINYVGYNGQTLDEAIINKFKELEKEVVALENIDIQFEALTAAASIIDIEKTLVEFNDENIRKQSEYCNALLDAFTKSEVEYPEIVVQEQKNEAKKQKNDVYNILHTNRNKGMVEKINEYMKDDKSYVVAVGYLHYFGEDSVLKMLEKEGYEIKKIS
ncbi:MAG: TraB/GumN family protein [Sarcina sp.]